MSETTFDLPLRDAAAFRLLGWVTGGLAYVAVLSLALALIANDLLGGLRATPKTITVALPVAEDAAPLPLAEVRALLEARPGVLAVDRVSDEALTALVAPMVGDLPAAERVALPRMFDVTYAGDARADIAGLTEDLRALVPGSRVDDQALRPTRFAQAARAMRLFGGALTLVLLLLAAAAAVVLMRLSLEPHRKNIGVLQMMGAAPGDIAQQFDRATLYWALWGGLIGLVAAIGTLLGVFWFTEPHIEGERLRMAPLNWLLLFAVPLLLATGLSTVAHLTVRHKLRQRTWTV